MSSLMPPLAILGILIAGVLILAAFSSVLKRAQDNPVKALIMLIAIVLALFGACVLAISGSFR